MTNERDNQTEVIREIAYAEFGGEFPDVPYAPGVDTTELTAGDADPFFITLPIAEVGLVSANNLRYTQEFCDDLVAQINTDKPTGIRGHIKEDDRNSAYPEPAVYWIGAIHDNGKVWAKGYIPPGATREEYRIKKATRASAATSIYGRSVNRMNHGDGTYTPKKMVLEQVDLAPPKRAAHGKGYAFAVTRELVNEEKTMDKTIQEMTADEVIAALNPAVVEQIVEMQRKPAPEPVADDAVLAEMKRTAAAKDATIAELEQTVAVQKDQLADLRERVVTSAVTAEVEAVTDWNVKSDEGKQKLGTLRTMLHKAAIAELSDDIGTDAIKAAVEKAVADQQFVVEMTRDALAGPNALAGAVNNRAVNSTPEISDEQAQAARAKLGF